MRGPGAGSEQVNDAAEPQLAQSLARHRAALKRAQRRGDSGFDTARANCAFFDELVRGLFQRALEQGEEHDPLPALIAVGGYGRGLLAPYSDIDLLFLFADGADVEAGRRLIERTLYPLWDLRLDLGHAARTIDEQLDRAIHDPTILTATLDCRALAGDEALPVELGRRLDAAIASGRVAGPVSRRVEPGAGEYPVSSVTVLEPNVKESPGALRDFQLALWNARVCLGVSDLAGLVQIDVLSQLDVTILNASIDFLLKLRCELHLLAGRRADVLSIEMQREVAGNLGFGAKSERQLIEDLLREYYLHARRVYDLLRRVNRRCARPRADAAQFSRTIEPGLLYTSEGVEPASADDLRRDPVLLMRTMAHVAIEGRRFSERGRALLREAADLIDEDFRSGREQAKTFIELLHGDHAALALRQMHELRLLGRYLPEFEALNCLPQYDIHHRFTVDEHTLLTIHFLEQLGGETPDELRRLAGVYRRLKRPEVLKLALLLHDMGKAGGPGHVERSLRLMAPVLHRLGVDEDDARSLEFLVRNHTAMSTLAQLRDIHDPKLLRRFAGTVGGAEPLAMLYLLTYADMRAVGPGIWSSWKGSLLEELYNRTRDLLDPGADQRDEDLREQLEYEVSARVAGRPFAARLQNYFAHMPENSLRWLSPARAVRHLKVLTGLSKAKPVSVGVFEEPSLGVLELVVATRDRRGLLWRIAGACTELDVNILGAQVFTRSDTVAIDTLQLEPPSEDPETGLPLLPPFELQTRLADRLERLFTGDDLPQQIECKHSPTRRSREMSRRVPVKVSGSNDESVSHSLIQVQDLDRLGLLYDVTRTIFKNGANVYLAKVNTEAGRAVDAFYVDSEGSKLSAAKLDELCSRIRDVLTRAQERQ
ncbi:MAG: [protein-PII] uridylyltransferase [Candidatus Alcyoniella australis]|nr:[protein-PII] uridylyltransferase [Candidatus Alcyoniella australis]